MNFTDTLNAQIGQLSLESRPEVAGIATLTHVLQNETKKGSQNPFLGPGSPKSRSHWAIPTAQTLDETIGTRFFAYRSYSVILDEIRATLGQSKYPHVVHLLDDDSNHNLAPQYLSQLDQVWKEWIVEYGLQENSLQASARLHAPTMTGSALAHWVVSQQTRASQIQALILLTLNRPGASEFGGGLAQLTYLHHLSSAVEETLGSCGDPYRMLFVLQHTVQGLDRAQLERLGPLLGHLVDNDPSVSLGSLATFLERNLELGL